MVRLIVTIACAISLAACDVQFGGAPLISGRSPPSALAADAEPQPANSLPPGAAGIGGGPNATEPNYGSITLGGAR